MEFKIGGKVRLKKTIVYSDGDVPNGTICMLAKTSDLISEIIDPLGRKWTITTESIEPVDADGGKIAYAPNGVPLFWMPEPKKPVSIEEQLGLPKGVSIHDLPTSELIKKEFNVAWIDKIALPTATETKEMVERVRREILKFTNAFPKEEKNLKFTFYVTEGTRVDKSCNGTIPTMTTTVETNGYSRTAPVGTATCDKADYDMRQGVLEALANMYCDGDFDKVYNKAVKRNELADKKKRTCTYCGKVSDTVEEKQAHEAWHVERKKARRERYLLRKRAKEIAFEEQAQKLAKEIIDPCNPALLYDSPDEPQSETIELSQAEKERMELEKKIEKLKSYVDELTRKDAHFD